MPTDTNAGVVFGAEHLPDARRRTTERLNFFGDRLEPRRNWRGRFEAAQRIVVAKSERGNPAFALILAELERLQRQRGDMPNQFLLDFTRDEAGNVTQSLRRGGCSGKKRKLLGQGVIPLTAGMSSM
jgi:hypothetical protein